MVAVSILSQAELGPNGHWEDSPLLSHAVVEPRNGTHNQGTFLKFLQWISSVISHNGLVVIKLFKIKQKLQK